MSVLDQTQSQSQSQNISLEKETDENIQEIKECAICYDELNNRNEIVKLNCGHEFHYECIFYAYKTKNKRKCPFCRGYGGYLQLKKNEFPVKNVHYEFNEIELYINSKNYEKLQEVCDKYYDNSKCNSIILNGQKKGSQCSKSKSQNSNYCYMHNKFKK